MSEIETQGNIETSIKLDDIENEVDEQTLDDELIEQDTIEETKKEQELPPREILNKGVVVNKDPKYFYYIDKDGNICRRRKGTTRKKKVDSKKIHHFFDKIKLNIPTIWLNAWVANKFKKVRKNGPTGGTLYLPKKLIGKEFMVILIPKEEWILRQIDKI